MHKNSGELGSYLKEMQGRADKWKPQVVSAGNSNYKNRKVAESVLPEGSSLFPQKKTADLANSWGQSNFTGAGGASFHTQRPYMPEFDSPDRQFYPDDRIEANNYWRLFHKTDPIFGTAVDMYASMMTSDFDIVLANEEDASIKNQLMDMCEQVNFLDRFQQLIKEYLVIGESFPHNFFDNEKGIWSYIAFHNPDYIDVQDSPIIDMDPIINFLPDDNLREMISANTPESHEIRKRLPSEFVSKVLARQKIRLSPLNCSFVARKLHAYDQRGTSLASRLWRIFMVEDAVYNSTIATFRRAASPLKVLKLGDPATGWIPDPSMEADFTQMLAQAEIDPQSWIITHYGVEYAQWGNTQSQAITLSRENDTIEKIKILALGMSKSFLGGEITYSSAKSGLQVFLRRLLNMRQFFESTWIMPKFFQPIIEINDWQRGTPAEVNHRIKIKRTAQEADARGLLIKPKIVWKNRLDPKVDDDTLNAYLRLKNLGFILSQDTVGSTVSLDWKDELRKDARAFKEREEILEQELGATLKQKYDQANPQAGAAQPKPPGGAGSGATPPGAAKKPSGGQPGVSAPPESGAAESGSGISDESIDQPSALSV